MVLAIDLKRRRGTPKRDYSVECIFLAITIVIAGVDYKLKHEVMKTTVILLLFSVLFTLDSAAQTTLTTNKKTRYTKLEAGYTTGGTFSNHYFAMNDGLVLGLYHGVKLSDHFSVSLGVGFEHLKEGVLLPMMLDVEAYGVKRKGYFNFKAGYSLGWSSRTIINKDYNYKGGYLFSLGYGFQLFKNEKWKLDFLPSYNFRQTRLSYLPELDTVVTPYVAKRKIHLISFKIVVSI